MAIISCCNFPTTLLVLDDDQDILKNIKYALSSQYKCICTSDIAQAEDILTKNRGWTKSLFGKGVSRIYQDDDPSIFSMSMDVPLIKKQVYNPDRFKHLAIIIVDYDMPGKNGLEFIRGLSDTQIKIIMLTGKAEQKTVIKAFNEREIHRYVSKADPDNLQTISQYIKELQDEFFFDFSKFILDSFLTAKESETKIFKDESFITLFNKIIEENDIVEYYLLEESGSFFFQDATAENQIFLIAKSKGDMQEYYELAEDDEAVPPDVVTKLKECKLIPCFNKPRDKIESAKYWNFVEAKPLNAKKKYYYAILNKDKDNYFKIDRSRIKSYQEFLSSK